MGILHLSPIRNCFISLKDTEGKSVLINFSSTNHNELVKFKTNKYNKCLRENLCFHLHVLQTLSEQFNWSSICKSFYAINIVKLKWLRGQTILVIGIYWCSLRKTLLGIGVRRKWMHYTQYLTSISLIPLLSIHYYMILASQAVLHVFRKQILWQQLW